ncbi:MAG: hypothetical protein IPL32_18885 [Chloracidobacterium sp.]|nr:hypothetical protein [Chloracidobacterium sp.]
MKMKSSKVLSKASPRSTNYEGMASNMGKHGKAATGGKEARTTSYSK